jgi:hypothetical protein
MPFTLAHPAAAVPLVRVLRRWGVLSALVIGSMTPDFAYFLPLGVARRQSHSMAGLVWFCLPVGLLTYWIFHSLAQRPVVALMPEGVARRLWPILRGPLVPGRAWPLGVLAIALSIEVGALTHVAWDNFTHRGATIVQALPPLHALLFEVRGARVHTYRVLQHGSSILGLGLLAWWGWRWLDRAPPGPPLALTPARTRALVVAAILLTGVAAMTRVLIDQPILVRALWKGTMAGTRGLLAAILIWSLLWWRSGTLRLGRSGEEETA